MGDEQRLKPPGLIKGACLAVRRDELHADLICLVGAAPSARGFQHRTTDTAPASILGDEEGLDASATRTRLGHGDPDEPYRLTFDLGEQDDLLIRVFPCVR